MQTAYWVKRFALALIVAFVIIAAAQVVKGRDIAYSLTHAGIWSVITAVIFTAASIYKARRRQQCAICEAPPQEQKP